MYKILILLLAALILFRLLHWVIQSRFFKFTDSTGKDSNKEQDISSEYRRVYSSPDDDLAAIPVDKCSIVLLNPGEAKLQVVKYLKEHFRLSLNEAKSKVDSAPCVIASDIDKSLAVTAKHELISLGAIVELRY